MTWNGQMTWNGEMTWNGQMTWNFLDRETSPQVGDSLKKKEDITINWNNTDYLSSVKNQGQCGSCYAFSTTNVLETFMRINIKYYWRRGDKVIYLCI